MPTAAEHRHAVGEPHGLVHVVRDEHHGGAELGLDAAELGLQPAAADRVDRTERLVHQQDRRVRRERAGARRAALALSLGDAAAESVGESVSRVRIHLDGLEAPALQVRLAEGGADVARVDFWWAAARVVGEFDGRKKYRVDGVPDRRSVEDRVWAEKQREDRLRDLGVRVVRWTWSDLWTPGVLARRLLAAGVRPAPSGRPRADRRRVGRKA